MSAIPEYRGWKPHEKLCLLDIKNTACKSRALAAKAPPIKLRLGPKTDRLWSRIHIDFAGPLDGFYYLITVDSFSKWPEIFRYKKATTEVINSFLHELFVRFWS